jgi:hypothetical protein
MDKLARSVAKFFDYKGEARDAEQNRRGRQIAGPALRVRFFCFSRNLGMDNAKDRVAGKRMRDRRNSDVARCGKRMPVVSDRNTMTELSSSL